MLCFIANFNSNSSIQNLFKLRLWRTHYLVMVACDSYLSKRMISFRHMLSIKYLLVYSSFQSPQTSFRRRRGINSRKWYIVTSFSVEMEGRKEGRKLRFEFPWNGRNSVTYSHLTNLTLSTQWTSMWSKYYPGFFIWRKILPSNTQLIIRGDKIQFQGHVDFKLCTFHFIEIRGLKRNVETCLPVQWSWTWKIMTERNGGADWGI